ncbi:MAG: lipid-A-disaccharide synthase N-terminal domain-containing protein [Alphaproteobacteria bacterium]|nr:lipid-A-disaccharide synthase N-terminal domain-containing protein [Alphaproteobacteria bacterium]
MHETIQQLTTWLLTQLNLWVVIGFFGQSLFMMRFIFQWIHSERAKQSVVPEIFWYFSLFGGLIVLAYAIHKQDIVFIVSQGLGSLIYMRNIQLIWQNKRKEVIA